MMSSAAIFSMSRSVVKGSATLGSFKTPQRLHASGTSPACFTPGVINSVHVNDDEAERRQRRLAAHMQLVMSPGCHTPRDLVTDCQRTQNNEGTSTTFSNAQIAEHYASCIKLSSENKISAKNAFGLHLIDYMAEMLRKRGEMMNFQVAGCTLDASAKIYAGRVDSIYNDAFKMLGGLGWNDLQEQDSNEENKNVGDAMKEKPLRKKKNTSATQCIEKNPESLNISSSDSDFEVDPLYRHPFAAFDEGGVESLLLNQLCVKDDLCALLLDASCILTSDDLALEYQNLKYQEVKGLKLQANFNCLEICDSFATFCFDSNTASEGKDFWNNNTYIYEEQWHKDALKDSSLDNAEYSMLQRNITSESNLQDPKMQFANITDDAIFEAIPEDDETIAVCGDMKLVEVFHNDPGMIQNENKGGLCLSEALAPSEYSYLNPSVLSTWAGPLHWKVKAKSMDRKIIECDQNANKPRTRQLVEQQQINFGIVPNDSLFCKGKAAIKLKTFTEEAVHLNTLPQDDHASLDVLFKLFMRPSWQVSRHSNLNSHHYSMKGTTEDVEPQEDLDAELFNDNDSVAHSELDEFAPVLQQQACLGTFEHLLVDIPKKVEQVQIDYAHSAKQVDVKRLKKEMWNILETQPTDATLKLLCEKLPINMPITIANHLSIPICFVCLLHLANEKDLRLYGNELMNDCCIQLCLV